MQQIEIRETTSESIKLKKYKSSLKRKIMLKNIQIAIIFALLMIGVRAVTLVLIADSPLPYNEIINTRYYYGEEKISVYGHIVVDTFFDINTRLICIMDIIIPREGNVFLWWFLYMSIIGFLGSKFVNMKKKRPVPTSIEEVEKRVTYIRSSNVISKMMVIIWVISFFIARPVTNKYMKEDVSYYNIKKIMDYDIINKDSVSGGEANFLGSYEEVINYAKGKTGTFGNILNSNGLESRTIPNGMLTANVNTTYEKYSNEYSIGGVYKLQPDFKEGVLE